MNRQQVQIFLTLASCRSFTLAGERLFLSQSAISYHIRAMEKELGYTLFERDTHSVCLTPAGESLCRSLSEVDLHMQDALDRARSIANAENDALRICFANPTHPTMMGRIINSLYRMSDFSRLELIKRNYSDILEPLLRGAADVLFSYPRFFRGESGLRMQRFCTVWPACLVSPDHPLAKEDRLSLGDLAGHRLLFPDCENIRINFSQIYDAIQRDPARMPTIDSTPQTFEQMQGLAAAGRGVLLVYTTDDVRRENIDGLVSIPLSDFDPDELVVIWRENHLNAPARALIESLS